MGGLKRVPGWLQSGCVSSTPKGAQVLDSYIIEELKRRERERAQRERQRPTLEIPIVQRDEEEDDRRSDGEDVPGKVVQIDF